MSSMWRKISRFYGRPYKRPRPGGGEGLPAESEEFAGVSIEFEGETREVVDLAVEHDLGVPRDLPDVFFMARRRIC